MPIKHNCNYFMLDKFILMQCRNWKNASLFSVACYILNNLPMQQNWENHGIVKKHALSTKVCGCNWQKSWKYTKTTFVWQNIQN